MGDHGRLGRAQRTAAVAAALATALLGSAACGDDSGGGGRASGPLKVWVRGADDSATAYRKVFAGFTARTGVKVDLFMTLTDFETKLNAAAAAHDLPDVVINDAAQLGAMKKQGIITEVDKSSITGRDKVGAVAWKSVQDIEGRTYGVPFSAQANVLLVRTDWLKKVGMPAPKTWDDLENVARAFTTRDPDGNGKNDTYGLAVPGSTQRGYIAWNWSSFLFEAGGDFLKPTGSGAYTSAVASPEAVEAADFYKGLFCEDKAVQPGALNHVTNDSNKAFQTGVAGMYLTGPYAYAVSDATEVKGKYTAVAPPAGPQGGAALAEGTSIYSMAGSKRAADFKKFAEYMISAKAQTTGMTGVKAATIVRLPVNQDVDTASTRAGDPRWKVAQQVYDDNAHYEPVNVPDWQAYRTAAAEALNKLVSGCGDSKKALSALDGRFRELLGKQGIAG
ncbi:ABC transporter substrate-binding protein [Wenjunlia tyrosinilytica]|uniref:Sugar ABC transporter substrate-binding protein n=1 Tax=Wenjunlia tyrosinilytica TaxID=1544741 RepID=A0A918DTC9_9ACTN|nr:sugar ABC transporter substrate-binding protein [Wenjunlia tyrosinilytica]GGO81510.1 sugar ABC transporter substrate-binding protein [Wenjunlia tyrosinilytica]